MVQNNWLDFGDIEPNIGVPNIEFTYSPQALVGEADTVTKQIGQEFRISVTVGGQSNTYQWYKNGNFITGALGSEFMIQHVTPDDSGNYTCRITNSIATLLTLNSQPITLQIGNTPITKTVVGTLTGTACYNVTQTISVAGNETTFLVQTGGSATMIAGQVIHYLPGTIVEPGGSMWGYIAPDGPYCTNPSIPAVVTTQEETMWGIEQTSFKIYPNPTTGSFILELTGEASIENVAVEIYGIWGEKVLTQSITGERKDEFSLSDKPVGVYFVRVISGNNAETVKIIKQ